jgi:hypothetical protein
MEAAAMIGYEENGAYRLLCRLSRVVPIVEDDENRWYCVKTS